MANKEAETIIARMLLPAALAIFFLTGGWSALWKYINREQLHHEKLTKVYHRGSWSLGEYQECNSLNTKGEDTEPELACGDSTTMDPGKTFMVRFSGDLTYDEDKKDGVVLRWRCRNNGDAEVAYSCLAIPSETGAPPNSGTEPQQPERQQGRELTSAEIDNLRKRNECEQRFYDKKIYEVDGMSIGPACKQNPDRLP